MHKNTLLISTIILIITSNPAFAGKLYKWVDENGKISFSDKVPPEESRREREELNEKGRTIVIKEAAKTPEQIQQLKKIADLQNEQAAILKEQLALDSALLKTFRTEEDIDALIKSKVDMVDSHISIAAGQSETLKKQLILHQKAAANFERSGKKIPEKNLNNIASAKKQYDDNQQEIAAFKRQKQELKEQLIKDKSRLSVLKSQSTETPIINTETIPSLFLGKLNCHQSMCDQLWEKATSFITEAGAIITYRSDKLILTKTPKLSKDRGLSLTKIKNQHDESIFLDVRCVDSKGGKATCKNTQTAQLIEKFNQLTP